MSDQENGQEAAKKNPWGYAVTRRLSVPGAARKPKGFWNQPEQVAAFRAIRTAQDVKDAAEFYNTTYAGVVWRLRYMGLDTPAAAAKAEAARAEVEAMDEATAERRLEPARA